MKKCQGTRKKDEKNALVPKTIIPQSAAVNIRDLYLFIALQMLIFMASGLQIPMNESAAVNIRDLYLFIALQMLIYMASGLQIPMNEYPSLSVLSVVLFSFESFREISWLNNIRVHPCYPWFY